MSAPPPPMYAEGRGGGAGDLDWGAKPYRRMKAHSAAVRAVAYHPRPTAYPLFATASDDGQVHVYHATVFDDLTKNPLIVPLKILKGHKIVRYLGVQTCKFRPGLGPDRLCSTGESVSQPAAPCPASDPPCVHGLQLGHAGHSFEKSHSECFTSSFFHSGNLSGPTPAVVSKSSHQAFPARHFSSRPLDPPSPGPVW